MSPPFQDRRHAGQILAEKLSRRLGGTGGDRESIAVLALPRGGVPVGFEVAASLQAPLDVFVVRKLRVPSQPELAMGAVASDGSRVINEKVVKRLEIPVQTLEEETREQMGQCMVRERQYRGDLQPVQPKGMRVVLVDDGLATGASMRAAVQALRQREPAEILVAVPVAPPQTVAGLQKLADDVVCLLQADNFIAVGQWYQDFSQTPDEEVRSLLKANRTEAGGRLVS